MEKYKATFIGNIHRKSYCVYSNKNNYRREKYGLFDGQPYLYESSKWVEETKFHECELEVPPLEVDELVYISDLDTTVRVERRARTTDGGYMYWTNHVVKTIEDEDSKQSKLEAEKLLEKYLKEYNDYIAKNKDENIKESKDDYITTRDNKWWQFWK